MVQHSWTVGIAKARRGCCLVIAVVVIVAAAVVVVVVVVVVVAIVGPSSMRFVVACRLSAAS